MQEMWKSPRKSLFWLVCLSFVGDHFSPSFFALLTISHVQYQARCLTLSSGWSTQAHVWIQLFTLSLIAVIEEPFVNLASLYAKVVTNPSLMQDLSYLRDLRDCSFTGSHQASGSVVDRRCERTGPIIGVCLGSSKDSAIWLKLFTQKENNWCVQHHSLV